MSDPSDAFLSEESRDVVSLRCKLLGSGAESLREARFASLIVPDAVTPPNIAPSPSFGRTTSED